jgi:creatinine amidohydrolase/Fe(II)-dependent formamide hydrolase-like protein
MQLTSLFRIKSAAAGLALVFVLLPVGAAQAASDQFDDLTTSELRERIAAGATTVLVPIGGTEQSGPYIALGKHNMRARLLAGQIAQRLGNTLVAQVITYVPEGSIHPPVAHMRFAGTISIPDGAFEAMLEGTVRSLKQHGVREVFLLADHGGYTKNLEHVASRLNREWAKDPGCHVHAVPEYYQAASTGFGALLKKRGFSDAEIGVHAGLADTALTLALDKSMVRTESMKQAAKPTAQEGVNGDPRRATAELGQLGVQLIVDASVAAIRQLTAADAGK